jgi:hypothetical protein
VIIAAYSKSRCAQLATLAAPAPFKLTSFEVLKDTKDSWLIGRYIPITIFVPSQ